MNFVFMLPFLKQQPMFVSTLCFRLKSQPVSVRVWNIIHYWMTSGYVNERE